MLDALLNILNGFTDIPFVELAWSHSPDNKYGVINLDTQVALNADEDPVSEKMLTGFVDVFERIPKTRPHGLSTVSNVESAMKRLGIWFALNSVQFEDDTGYVHYEWIWKDTPNIVPSKLYVCRFHAHNGYIGEPQIVEIGNFVVVPTDYIPPYTQNGISYTPGRNRWKPNPSVPVFNNTVYERLYSTEVIIENGKAYKSTGVAFTPSQINDLIAFFGNGNNINCLSNGGVSITSAIGIDTEKITYNGGSAVWA